MRLKPLFATDIDRRHLAETRRKPIHGGSASASLRLTVSARYLRSMSLVIIYGTAVNGTKLRVLSMTFQQLGEINCCHANCKGCESGKVGNDHHPQGRFLLLDNCSCVVLLPSIHGHMQNLHFHRPWWSDAGFESPWMGLRRVFGGNTKVMPRCQCIYLKLLLTNDMNRRYLVETRRESVHGGSTPASDHHGRWKCRFCRSKNLPCG